MSNCMSEDCRYDGADSLMAKSSISGGKPPRNDKPAQRNCLGLTNAERRRGENTDTSRYVKTVALFAGYVSLGFDITILGLSLPSLAQNGGLSIEQVSPAVVVRGTGFLIGSAASSVLDRLVDTTTIIIASLLCKALGLFFTPVIFRGPLLLFLSTAINSIGMGLFETMGNVYCIRLWGRKRVEPFMQFIHFGYCLGCVTMPVLAKPFLNEVAWSTSQISAHANFTQASTTTHVSATLDHDATGVGIAYAIIASFSLILAATFLSLKLFTASPPSEEKRKHATKQGKRFWRLVMCMFFVYFLVYNGIEITFISFLFTFAVAPQPGLALTKNLASDLATVFYVFVLLGQFFAIFLSRKLQPGTIMIVDIAGLVLSVVCMSMLPLYRSALPVLFWVAVGCAGLSAASLYSTTFLWAERYIVVDGRAASVFVVGAALGEMLLPLPIGQLVGTMPSCFLYINALYTALLVCILIVMLRFTRGHDRKADSITMTDDIQRTDHDRVTVV